MQLWNHSHKPHFQVWCFSRIVLNLFDFIFHRRKNASWYYQFWWLSNFMCSADHFEFSSHNGLTKEFALCLPSTDQIKGVIFFRDGPHNFLPHTKIEQIGSLSYTPLLKRPESPEYYIGVDGKASYFRTNTLSWIHMAMVEWRLAQLFLTHCWGMIHTEPLLMTYQRP